MSGQLASPTADCQIHSSNKNHKQRLSNLLFVVFSLVSAFALPFSAMEAVAKTKIEPANEFGETANATGTYFHLYAEYLVSGSEELFFDLQVSCGTHRFENGRLVRGYLPALYAKRTSSGAAVMIAIPRVCDAIRYAEDRQVLESADFKTSWQHVLNGNFIPFTIWFKDLNDLTFGYGYAIAESFKNPESPITFVGARVMPSTERAFSSWIETDTENLLKGIELGPQFATEQSSLSYWKTFDPEKRILPLACHGVAIVEHHVSINSEWVKKFYPIDKPRYWFAPRKLPKTKELGKPSLEHLAPFSFGNYYGGSPSHEFPIGFNYLRREKEKIAGNPSLWSIDAPEYYPLVRSDAHPFVAKRSLENKNLKFTVDVSPEKRGLLACYSRFNPIGYAEDDFESLYEYHFGPEYGAQLVKFGEVVELEIVERGKHVFSGEISSPFILPNFLISDESAAEFVKFEFFGGGHVR